MHKKQVLTDHAIDRCIERSIDNDMCKLARLYGQRLNNRNRYLLRYEFLPEDVLEKLDSSRRQRLQKILPICCVWDLHPKFNDEVCITAWRVFNNDKGNHRLNWKRGKASSHKHRNHKYDSMTLLSGQQP